MFEPLTWALVALSLLAMMYAVVLAARDRRIDTPLLIGVGLIELGLVVQLVIGIVQLATTDNDVSGVLFLAYLIGSLLILPIGTVWAIAERSRWGAGVLAVACLVMPILELRMYEIWTA